MGSTQNYINHVAFVFDASYSMNPYQRELISVADDLTGHLARRSTELDQETRITSYTFNDLGYGAARPNIQCVFYDKDALRMPSIKDYYKPDGGTPLLDATLKAIDDLEKTPQLYGDHAFLLWVLSDGDENRSKPGAQQQLERKLATLPGNWTTAILVPDMKGRRLAERFGFPADNIAIWEPTSGAGVARGGDMVRQATDTFMTSRASGIRGTRSLFSTGVEAVNAQTVKSLTPMPPSSYMMTVVLEDSPVRDWCEKNGVPFRLGNCYYQLIKTETIQPQKSLLIHEKKTGHVYGGREARDLVGLPSMTVRVKPDQNPEYDIFVQSTSTNRKMLTGQKILVER